MRNQLRPRLRQLKALLRRRSNVSRIGIRHRLHDVTRNSRLVQHLAMRGPLLVAPFFGPAAVDAASHLARRAYHTLLSLVPLSSRAESRDLSSPLDFEFSRSKFPRCAVRDLYLRRAHPSPPPISRERM